MGFRKYQLILEFEEANRPLTQIENVKGWSTERSQNYEMFLCQW